MSSAAAVTSRRALADLVIPWACLSLAGAFWAWLLTSSVEELATPEAAARGFAALVAPAVLGAGAAAAVLFWFGATVTLARASCASALCYLAFLKMAGVALAPWIALVATLVAAVGMRGPPAITPALLLLHAMGAMAGFHMVFALPRYLAAVPSFRAVLGALWRLL